MSNSIRYAAAQVANLDGSVECFSQRIEALVEENNVLEGRVEEQHRKLEAEELRRKAVEDDVMLLLYKGVVRVVDKVVERVEFSLEVRRMKVTYIVSNVEGGKQVVRKQVVGGKFDSGESTSTLELTQAMQASVKAFMEMEFTSYFHLCELDLGGLYQLCNDPEVEDVASEHDPSKVGTYFDSLGK
ncbi:unnamed protein product [Lactuca saligna]|uniref:Uncharacterized protein n=1 Tax=Lactuca saligna TaxID=75948 RepID=A0AA35ZAK1_LACSI|nr:unnamed protein product [Lactuca saligna]